MGYNTVVFILNDFSHEIKKSPNSVLWMIAHPPLEFMRDKEDIRKQLVSVAREADEPVPHPQMISVLPAFHADSTRYYRAGGNCIDTLELVKFSTVKGEKCVVLKLPEYMQK